MWTQVQVHLVLWLLFPLTIPNDVFCTAILQRLSVPKNKVATDYRTLDKNPPLIYAHRGESSLLPAHTLAAYEIAILEGADFIEPDLQLTKDGVLVCFHDLALDKLTNVKSHKEFAHLKTNLTGEFTFEQINISNDWLLRDFTLEQLQTLKVIQTPGIGNRPQVFNGLFGIPTFNEFLQLVKEMSTKTGKSVGIIPELKHPKLFNAVGNRSAYNMEDIFVHTLTTNGFSNSSVRVQCFDEDTLDYLATKVPKSVELILLVETRLDYLTPGGIQSLVNKGTIGEMCVWKDYIRFGIEKEAKQLNYTINHAEIQKLGGFIEPAEQLVDFVHENGLRLCVYTVNEIYSTQDQSESEELLDYFWLGFDGVFVDNVQQAVMGRLTQQSQC